MASTPSQPEDNAPEGVTASDILTWFGENVTSRVSVEQPAVVAALMPLVSRLSVLLGGLDDEEQPIFPISNPRQLFRLCFEADQALGSISLPEEAEDILCEIRAQIARSVLAEVFAEDPSEFGDVPALRNRLMQERMAHAASQLMALIGQHNPDRVSPEWIRQHHERLYDRIVSLLLQYAVDDWGPILTLLPQPIRQICDLDRVQLEQAKEDLMVAVEAFREVMNQWPELAADIFVLQHPEFAQHERDAQNILRTYLGNVRGNVPIGRNLRAIPPTILELPQVRRVAHLLLRRQVYRELEPLHDLPLDAGDCSLPTQDMIDEANDIVHRFSHPREDETPEATAVYQRLEDELKEEFKALLELPIPQRLNGVVVSKDGEGTRYGVSLRQRIAMYDMLHLRDHDELIQGKLLAFYMGMGKTLGSFLVYESLQEQGCLGSVPATPEAPSQTKMLYVCPNGELPKQVAAQVREHYKEGCAPTVGIVDRHVQTADLPQVLESEIVIVPYSMLITNRGGRRMVDYLIESGFNLVVQDEPQNADKPGQAYTDRVREVIEGCGAHCFLQLSGNPYPNSPEDAVAQLALARPDLYRDNQITSLRDLVTKVDPRALRAAMHEFVLCLDEPEDLEPYITDRDVILPPDQLALYESLLAEEEITQEKISQLLMALLNPALLSPGIQSNAVAEDCADALFEYLEGDAEKELEARPSVVMFESLRKLGVMRRVSEDSPIPSFYEVVQARLLERMSEKYGEEWQNNVVFYTIDGDTPEVDRQFYLLRAQYPHLEPVLRLYLMATSRFKRQQDYEMRIDETSSRLDIAAERLRSLMRDRTLEGSFHAGRREDLCELIRSSDSLAQKLTRLIEKKDESALLAFVLEHPFAGPIVSEYQQQQAAAEEGEMVEVDQVGIFEVVFDHFLNNDGHQDVREWLQIYDVDGQLLSACSALVGHEERLKRLRVGQRGSYGQWTARMKRYLREHYDEDRVTQLEAHEQDLDRLVRESDGHFAIFHKLFEEQRGEEGVSRWLADVESAFPMKLDKVVLYSWLTIIHEGIDLSLVDRGIFVDPAMRKWDMFQAIKRFVRHGKEALFTCLNVPGTIFEGIREHADNKLVLVLLLLYGGYFTEEEIAYIENGDFGEAVTFVGGRLLFGSPVMQATLSSRQRLACLFAYLHNQGVDNFRRFLHRYGELYAQLYMMFWESSYSANNGRFVSGLADELREDQDLAAQGVRTQFRDVLDLGCGPCVFENTYNESHPDGDVRTVSSDLSPHVLEAGVIAGRERREDERFDPPRVVCSMTDIRDPSDPSQKCPAESFDLVNCALSLNYLGQRARSRVENHERAQALMEMYRVLRPGGLMVLTLPLQACSEEEFAAFCSVLPYFGFEVLPGYTGTGRSTDRHLEEQDFSNRVVTCRKVEPRWPDAVTNTQELLSCLRFTRQRRTVRPSRQRRRRGQRRPPTVQTMHHRRFEINQQQFDYDRSLFDHDDDERADELQETIRKGREIGREMIERCGYDPANWDADVIAQLLSMRILINYNSTDISEGEEELSAKHRLQMVVWQEGTLRNAPIPLYEDSSEDLEASAEGELPDDDDDDDGEAGAVVSS